MNFGALGGRRLAVAMVVAGMLGGCADVGGLMGGDDAPSQPDLEQNRIARMSAQNRYHQAIGCASTARLVLGAGTPEALMELGIPAEHAGAGARDFAANAESAATMGEEAARDAIAVGAQLGAAEDAVVDAMEADYQRLVGAFRGVAEPEPQVALFTISDRLQRCRHFYDTH